MPMFRHTRRMKATLLGGFALMALAGLVVPHAVVAQQQDDYVRQFHSFVPPSPSFKVPKFGNLAIWQSDMRKAKTAWRKGNYQNARKHLMKALKKGNVIAGWYLGHMYQQGRGVDQNPAMAYKFYRGVAITYEPDAPLDRRSMIVIDSLVRVAHVYRDGLKSAGIGNEYGRALRLYNVASTHGHPGGDYGMGVMHLRGLGVNKNPKRALRWLSRSARKRYAPAEALLGDLYWQGTYVHQNRPRAIMWYLLAGKTANPAVHPHIHDRLEAMLTKATDEERVKAEKLATRWGEKYPVRVSVVPIAE